MKLNIDELRDARDRAAALGLRDLVRILDMAILELALVMSETAEPRQETASKPPE